MKTLKQGSTGPDVTRLQVLLGLRADGDFGPATKAAVIKFQASHNLTADGIVGQATWKALLTDPVAYGVTYLPIREHITGVKSERTPKYLVIHYTAGASSAPGSARKVREVFLSRAASADYVVDDSEVIQVNPDPRRYYCWAVGDGKGRYGIVNKDCISIEICSTLRKGTRAAVPNHTGWSFTPAVLAKATELAKSLITEYGIPKERVIRHYDASRKLCPGVPGWNPGELVDPISGRGCIGTSTEDEWNKFLQGIFGE